MVALEALQLRAMGCSDIPALFLYVGKRRPPVYLSLPPARKVEIWAVQQKQLHLDTEFSFPLSLL